MKKTLLTTLLFFIVVYCFSQTKTEEGNKEDQNENGGVTTFALPPPPPDDDDDAPKQHWFRDADRDGFGDPNHVLIRSAKPTGYAGNPNDCNDSDYQINPNTLWYRDADGDGYGNISNKKASCLQPLGYVRNKDDCNDNSSSINPNTTWYLDADGDGYAVSTKKQCSSPGSSYTRTVRPLGDCNDSSAAINPNTKWYKDTDGDGYASTVKTQCTNPGSGYTRTVKPLGDCNDNNASLNPKTTWYKDSDGDGFASTTRTQCSSPGSDYTQTPMLLGDCDDNNASLGPTTVWYLDADGDGYSVSTKKQCSSPGSGYTRTVRPLGDCNDSSAAINPNTKWYKDSDGDGFASTVRTQCSSPGSGYTRTVKPLGDCNDNNASINPDTRWYLDADGDGFASTVRTQCSSPGSGYTLTGMLIGDCDDNDATANIIVKWYLDADGDGYASTVKTQCTSPGSGYTRTVKPLGDCNDNNASLNPKTTWYKDSDGDGFASTTRTQCSSPGSDYTQTPMLLGDCDDNNASLHPTTIWYLDADGDGYAVSTKKQCSSPGSGYTRTVRPLGDCNDSSAAINPNTKWYKDSDGDGYASTSKTQCISPGSGYTRTVKPLGDCNDNNVSINPDTRWYLDADGDGFASTVRTQCSSPGSGYTLTGMLIGDCDDNNSIINPGTKWYKDTDGDGYASTIKTQCTSPGSGYTRTVKPAGDCDDNNPSLNPNITWYLDADGDGFAVSSKKQCTNPGSSYTRNVLPITDCNDSSAAINPNTKWYSDSDADGYGDSSTTRSSCNKPAGYVANDDDYDDTTNLITNIAPKYFYKDADGDGYGDPNSRVYRSVKPSGYVTNNTDQCPDVSSSNSNGCLYETVTLSNENYIYTRTYQRPMSTDQSINANSDVIEQVTYFDGLGRPMQEVAIKGSPTDQKDIVRHIGYDGYGRQDKDWLPYHDTGAIGSYRSSGVETATQSYYKTNYGEDFTGIATASTNPYSQKDYEASPLNRVLKQAAPGADWRLSAVHTIDFKYIINKDGEVRNFSAETVVVASEPTSTTVTYRPQLNVSSNNSGFYAAGELYKTITYDENHTSGKLHSTEEFTDKQGQVVLKRTYGAFDLNGDGDTLDSGEQAVAHDTYYVYDDYGNLTYVLPPKMNATTASLSTIQSNLDALGYQYTYDGRNRLVEKQVAGKEVEYIVYNKLDQPILTQDANQRVNNEWLFTKYDAFGRVAYTGKATDSRERSHIQVDVSAYTGQLWVERVAFTSLGGAPIYYSNHGYPNATSTTGLTEVLTIQYYDDYNFPELLQGQVPSNLDSWGVPVDPNAKGLPTISQTKVLSTSGDWINSAIAYDDKGRQIWSYSGNSYLKTTTIVATQLDFPGRVTGTYTLHQKEGKDDLVTIDTYSYDHMGRLKEHLQQIGGYDQPAELIAENTYDDLGQLISKGVGNTTTQPLQTVAYQYNIRGWLKKINNPSSLGTNLFGFEIKYNDIADPTKKLYNGNISQTLWNSKSVNPNPPNNPVSNQYTYSYDALNRITGAVDNTTNYNVSGITYDQNGNILTLQRQGHTNASATLFGTMDNLVYTYDRGNKLTKVLDNESDTYGFKDGANTATEYIYDTNGNLTSDANKGITAIEYNHLNMPTKVTVTGANAGVLDYVYSADGTKLRRIKTQGGIPTTTDYTNGYIYENNQLQFFNTSEGYVTPDGSGGYDYVYQYKDHLGSVRLSYSDLNEDGVVSTSEVLQERNYYPFGAVHKGYNNAIVGTENNYQQYQGQELDKSLDLGWHHFKYRIYDDLTGRFLQIDPLATTYVYNSTYAFAENNVTSGIDLEGKELSFELDGNRATGVSGPRSGGYTLQEVRSIMSKRAAAYDVSMSLLASKASGATPRNHGEINYPTSDINRAKYIYPQSGLMIADGVGIGAKEAVTDVALGGALYGAFKGAKVLGSVWKMNRFARGRVIEDMLGAAKSWARNFPVIDKIEDGVATSIKSMDLTAKSYQNGNKVFNTLKGYINKLDSFTSKSWAGVEVVQGESYTSKALELSVQTGKGTDSQWNQIQSAIEYAIKKDINVTIRFID